MPFDDVDQDDVGVVAQGEHLRHGAADHPGADDRDLPPRARSVPSIVAILAAALRVFDRHRAIAPARSPKSTVLV